MIRNIVFERITEPPLEPPEDVVFAECACCADNIYEGESYFEIDGDNIHEDCLADYFADCRQEAQVYAEMY